MQRPPLGGEPRAFLASTGSARWRENFIRTYLERDIPALGPRVPAQTLRRFRTMLAHAQGGLRNAAAFARSLAVDGQTIARYLDLLVDLLLARRLLPFHANVRKRLVKSPKIYVRDSGIAHSLPRLPDAGSVLGHPVAGASWEGFVVETLLRAAPERAQAGFYRAATGAEIDLVMELPGDRIWAMEIKRGLAPSIGKGFRAALDDARPDKAFLVHGGSDRYPKCGGVEAVGLMALAPGNWKPARSELVVPPRTPLRDKAPAGRFPVRCPSSATTWRRRGTAFRTNDKMSTRHRPRGRR